MVIVTSFSLGMVLVRTDAGQLVMVPQQALAQAQMQAQVQTQGQGPASISPRLSVPTSGPVFRLTTAQVCLAWFHLAFVCFVLLCLVHYQFFDKCASHIFFLIGNQETLTQIQFIISGLIFFFFLISEKSTLQVFSSLFRLWVHWRSEGSVLDWNWFEMCATDLVNDFVPSLSCCDIPARWMDVCDHYISLEIKKEKAKHILCQNSW